MMTTIKMQLTWLVRMKSIRTFFFLGFILFLVMSGCTRDADEEKAIVMCYTSIPLEIMTDIKTEFEQHHPPLEPVDIEVRIYREGSGNVIAKLAAEEITGGIRADLLWIAEPSYYYELKNRGTLLPYTSKWDADIPDRFKDADRTFCGARLFTMAIVYNTEHVSEPPRTWQDLLDPKWSGEVVMANPLYSGASMIFTGAMVNAFGWDYFEKLQEQGLVVVRGNSSVATKVATGEFNVGITIHNMVLDLRNQGSPIDVVYPADGHVLISSPIAIFRNTERDASAKLFLDYMLSPEGQRLLVSEGGFIPVRDDVQPPADTPSFEDLTANAFDLSWLTDMDKVEAIKTQFRATVLYKESEGE